MENIVLAYEPVWLLEREKQLHESRHKKCMNLLEKRSQNFGDEISDAVSIYTEVV
jgi:triosephosphate isomerase